MWACPSLPLLECGKSEGKKEVKRKKSRNKLLFHILVNSFSPWSLIKDVHIVERELIPLTHQEKNTYWSHTHLDVKMLEEEEHLWGTSGRNKWQMAKPYTESDYFLSSLQLKRNDPQFFEQWRTGAFPISGCSKKIESKLSLQCRECNSV